MTADLAKASLNAHNESVIAVSNLRTTFNTPNGLMSVVDGVTLTIGFREAVGIVGESGSGKSMLVRSIMGLLPSGAARNGKVIYEGQNLVSLDPKALRH